MKATRRIRRIWDNTIFRLGRGPARMSHAAREAAFRSPLYAITLKGRTPGALTQAATPPWTDDATDAATLMAGFLNAAGRRVSFDDDPWATLPHDDAVRADANGFLWLDALGRDGGAEALARGRRLIETWLDANARWSPDAWAPDTLADRIALWAYWLPVFTADDGNTPVRDRALKSLGVQARHLLRRGPAELPRDWRAFAVCRGLVRCGLAIGDEAGLVAGGLKRLETAISRQILPDGGHIQRCPSLHMRVLALLTDIRDTLLGGQVEPPTALQSAIDRMAPMLRLFRLGDGGLTVVNGGHEETRQAVDAVLAASGSKAKGLINAPHTGFQRLAAGPTVIVADTGTPPPPGAQSRAHAGPLAFEMSVGPHRVVVNCGAPVGADPAWMAATRATAAHSTVGIDDTNAVEFLPGGRIGVCPTEVHSQRRESDGAIWLDTEHNGYDSAFDIHHKRRFFLTAGGEDFRGEDVLIGDGAKTFRARFHLHPQIQASLIQGGTGVLLRLPGGVGWRFFATGGTVSLEDSIYLGAGGRYRRAEQIVVSGLADTNRTVVKWRFSRVG